MATPGTLLSSLQGLPKLALSYIFKGLDSVNPVESKDERIRMLKRVEFYSVVEAGALGLLSGLILLLFTLWIEAYRGTILESEFWDNVVILGIIIAVGVIITMIELTVMYFLSLRNARIIASLNEQSTSSDDIDEQVMVALVNAGLQTPNNTGEFFGINPRKHMSKWSIALAAFFLKTKVSGSRAIIKMMWKRFAIRVLGRTVSRGALELASLPVFAFWNMLVMRSTIRELRMRSEMPLREDELIEFITMDSTGSTELCLDTIEEHIFCHGDVHPNVERIFKRIHDERVSWNSNVRNRLSKRQHDEFSQSKIELEIRTLIVTMAIDPRSSRKQRKLFKQLKERCENNEIEPYDITHSILNGKPLPNWTSQNM
ncbi:MAG: hypothetical protein QGF34_05310 [Candidatus Poseidoniaceae archaeon]|nr:hypothetical protein [Candidatus Poseidoniaceae archaeon]